MKIFTPKVTSWQNIPDNVHSATEKLSKDSFVGVPEDILYDDLVNKIDVVYAPAPYNIEIIAQNPGLIGNLNQNSPAAPTIRKFYYLIAAYGDAKGGEGGEGEQYYRTLWSNEIEVVHDSNTNSIDLYCIVDFDRFPNIIILKGDSTGCYDSYTTSEVPFSKVKSQLNVGLEINANILLDNFNYSTDQKKYFENEYPLYKIQGSWELNPLKPGQLYNIIDFATTYWMTDTNGEYVKDLVGDPAPYNINIIPNDVGENPQKYYYLVAGIVYNNGIGGEGGEGEVGDELYRTLWSEEIEVIVGNNTSGITLSFDVTGDLFGLYIIRGDLPGLYNYSGMIFLSGDTSSYSSYSVDIYDYLEYNEYVKEYLEIGFSLLNHGITALSPFNVSITPDVVGINDSPVTYYYKFSVMITILDLMGDLISIKRIPFSNEIACTQGENTNDIILKFEIDPLIDMILYPISGFTYAYYNLFILRGASTGAYNEVLNPNETYITIEEISKNTYFTYLSIYSNDWISIDPENVKMFEKVLGLLYLEPSVIRVGSNEPLTVLATSKNTIAKEVWSKKYPNDIIYYDWNFENFIHIPSFVNNGSPVPGWKGIITRREDTLLNNKVNFDYREITYRLWNITQPQWESSSGYTGGEFVTYNGYIYYSINSSTSYQPDSYSDYWMRIIGINFDYFSKYKSFGSDFLYIGNIDIYIPIIDEYDFIDVKMFSDTESKNNIFDSCSYLPYNIFGENCSLNNFGMSCYSNIFGSNFYNNDLGSNCNNNIFGIYSSENILNLNCSYNIFPDYSHLNELKNGVSFQNYTNSQRICCNVVHQGGEDGNVYQSFIYGSNGMYIGPGVIGVNCDYYIPYC